MASSVLVIRHIAHEPAGTLADALEQAAVPFHYLDLFDYHQTDPQTVQKWGLTPEGCIRVPGQLLPPGRLSPLPNALIENLAGLVVMGGPMNVDEIEKYPFLAAEPLWIRQAYAQNVPILGVCLGAQLLAKAHGAKVYPNSVKEIGWYPLELTPAAKTDHLLHDCNTQLTVFQWHGDTFDLPSSAIHLARSPQCPHQAFRIGNNAYGLQFHIEMTAEMIENWLKKLVDSDELNRLDCISPSQIRQQTPAELPALQTLAAKVLGRFAELCRKRLTAMPN